MNVSRAIAGNALVRSSIILPIHEFGTERGKVIDSSDHKYTSKPLRLEGLNMAFRNSDRLGFSDGSEFLRNANSLADRVLSLKF